MYITLGLKLLLYPNEKLFDFKLPHSYILNFQWQEMYSCETVCITRESKGRNCSTYTIMQCLSHACNFRIFIIVLLALLIFLLYGVRAECRYVLSNLARYNRSTWHTGWLSMFTSNHIGGIVSERPYR